MNLNPIKTINFDNCQLKKGQSKFTVKVPYAYADLKTGNWQVALHQISYRLPDSFSTKFFHITCNLTTGHKSTSLGTESCLTPIGTFVCKDKTGQAIFEPIWFNVNNSVTDIDINFEEILPNNRDIVNAYKFSVTLLLRKMY